MNRTKIEWTERTWNPVVGCTRVSAGCTNCYAERMSHRLQRLPQYAGLTNEHGRWSNVVRCLPERLDEPLRVKRPSRIFVCSMSDLFHESVPFEFIREVYRIIERCPQHVFVVLTKRAQRAVDFYGGASGAGLSLPADCVLRNVWLGVSVENQAAADERIPHLLRCPAKVRWLSCEPLLGGLDLCNERRDWLRPIESCTRKPERRIQAGIDWVVCGGETGPHARPMSPDWARSIRDQCKAAGVAFFFKQMTDRAEIPTDLMIREYPA